MKIQWFLSGLLPGLASVLWAIAPAWAGELASWQFDATQNFLEFTTNEQVQPRAQLVPDPTRLVIDLPGTTIGNVQLSQLYSGAIQQVRVAQFDHNTTRIVLELTPGYMINPQQIQFRGLSPTHWTVQIPNPEYRGVASAPPPASLPTATVSPPAPPRPIAPAATPSPAPSPAPTPSASVPSPTAAPPANAVDSSVTQVEGLRITDDGIFVRTRGATPTVNLNRSRDRRSITVTVDNAVLSSQLTEREVTAEQFGIERLEFSQDDNRSDDNRSRVRITLDVDRNSPDWQASASGLGGIVLLPSERQISSRNRRSRDSEPPAVTRDPEPPSTPASTSSTPPASPAPVEAANQSEPASSLPIATIEGVEVDPNERQLLIRSDRAVTHVGRWRSGLYEVSLSPARLADRVSGPQLNSNSPLLRVRLRQEDDDTVLVMIQPAAGVRFGSLNAVSPQLLALEMERAQPTIAAPMPTSPTPTPQPVSPNAPLPRIPTGRLVVVIDPGHGGADVGAVGIGGIREADIVLPISHQVAALLQQQGVYVVMTRSDDREIDLEPRVQMAEQANATLFVSIHANSISMDRPDVNGAETYYYSSGQGLAQVIQTSIVSNVGMNDRGARQARFYVLRRTSMPAVLVEIGYVTGSDDAPRLADSNFQSQMARAIAQGILLYIQQQALVRE